MFSTDKRSSVYMLYKHSGIVPTSFGHALLVNVQLYSNDWPFIFLMGRQKYV